MRLVEFCIEGFRGYHNKVCLKLDNLVAIIGKNDAGKSTILEAMDAFFNNAKLDSGDYCVNKSTQEIVLTALFDNLPESIIIDEAFKTSLKDEYLLNSNGLLEIRKIYKGASPALKETYLIANHPNATSYQDLLSLKITELRGRAKELALDIDSVNKNVKSEIRQLIWKSCADLKMAEKEILVKDEDTKKIAENIESYMPVFALFKSDRASTDQDAEVQDPMQLAIKEALKLQEKALNEVAKKVEDEVRQIAERTVEKLKQMDADLASELIPMFKTDWGKVFKLSLTADNDIPLNKRGSGVRRLVLLNFFRVKAEQLSSGSLTSNTIYAIEEPETSQHPDKQRMLMEAFQSIAESGNSQVFFTTHTPMLASLLDRQSIRYLKSKQIINSIVDDDAKEIAKSLGVLPDHKVKLFIGLEGRNDINFMINISKVISSFKPELRSLEDLEKDGLIMFIPMGGSSFKLWINRLNSLNRPEIHICDRDHEPPAPPHYHSITSELERSGKTVFTTNKREMENYIHHQAIEWAYASDSIVITLPPFSNFDNIPEIVAIAVHNASESGVPWESLDDKKKKDKEGKAKKILNDLAVLYMDEAMYRAVDPDEEILGWLNEINRVVSNA